ncbi:MAG: putative Multi-sensor signal transduction histidine kinase [Candidatus Saccharibacteria bacterium]|nr:putative Multi-sensor signal transduction histidine kinase [Candidatus Saccharibacteria bacterium]
MYQGGVKINEKTAQIIRFASLIMPVALTFYGLFIQYGVANTSHYVSDAVFFGIMIPWIVMATFHFLYTSISRTINAVALIIFHVLAVLYILFVSGFANPFIAGWIILFSATYAYFGRDGLRLSIVVLVATAAADAVLHSYSSSIIFTDILTALAILIVGVTAISISQAMEVDSEELTRSKAQETLERDRILTIVNNLADAVLSTDENGIIRVYNAACLNLLDTNTGLDGKNIDEILTLVDADNTQVKLLDNLQKSRGVVVRDDVTMNVADETIRLEVTYSPIRSSYSVSKHADSQDGYILILRDITKAKSLEEERDEFISVVSHELRTPITIAEGTISNVQLMMDRPNIAKKILQDAVTTAHDQVVFLAKMVNDLSTLSRAERGVADEEEEIDVKAMVNDLFGEYSPQAAKKGLQFNLDAGSHLGNIMASRLYLHELLQNFVTNSIKYTKGGSVTLRAHRKDDIITFEVKDTGIGISKADQAKVFKKFYRSEDYRTRETGGTGLGLYVAVKLAKKLGTSINLTSRLNHGSSFSFDMKSKIK